MAISMYLSIITLNINGLNVPIKRHKVTEWIQSQDLSICCIQEIHFRSKDTQRLKGRGWKKVLNANGNNKKGKVVILILDKIDFKAKTVTKDKEGHYIMISDQSKKKI